MSTIKAVLRYTYRAQECNQIFYYVNTSVTPTNALLSAFAAAWVTVNLADYQAATVDGVVFDTLDVSSNNIPSAISYSLGAVTGDIVAADAGELPPNIVANIKKSVADSYDPNSGAAYTGLRPIRFGRFYMSGLAKGLMAGNGINTADTSYAAFTSLLATQAQTVTVSGGDWTPVVLGFPLPARAPSPTYPTGIPARDYVVADIFGCTFKGWTKLETRESS